MNQITQAKVELQTAWNSAQTAETSGIGFGKVVYEWNLKLGADLYPLYKELGIRPTDANWWMEKYKTSIGLKDLHKEKRPSRSSPNSFTDIQSAALRILGAGFMTLVAQESENTRLLQSAKDWAYARLSREDL